MVKIILLSFSILCLQVDMLMCQSIQTTKDLANEGIATVNLYSVIAMQETAIKSVSVDLYSRCQLNLQKRINENSAEYIVVRKTEDEISEWTSIDHEDITPATWQWIDLEVMHSNGDTSVVSLRRPLWWLKRNDANAVGDKVFIDMPEMGIEGYGRITNIRPSQLDSRLLPTEDSLTYATRPITGKFIHTSNNVYDLYFAGNNVSLGVTGNHPIWSVTRNKWIESSKLYVGEEIITPDDKKTLKLTEKKEKSGRYSVYNIEVYRAHNYYAQHILVHNACIGKRSVNDIVKSKILPYRGQVTVDAKFVEKAATEMEEMIRKTGSVDWGKLTRNSADGVIRAVRYGDGTIVIIDGRHRVLAAELAGAKVPWDDPNVVKLIELPYSYKDGPHYSPFTWKDVQWGTGKKFEVKKK